MWRVTSWFVGRGGDRGGWRCGADRVVYARVAADLGVTAMTVRKWRKRHAAAQLAGLATAGRPGRRASSGPSAVDLARPGRRRLATLRNRQGAGYPALCSSSSRCSADNEIARESQAITRRIRRAKFEAQATLEAFDSAASPKIVAAQIRELASAALAGRRDVPVPRLPHTGQASRPPSGSAPFAAVGTLVSSPGPVRYLLSSQRAVPEWPDRPR
jgi:transposase-like protein